MAAFDGVQLSVTKLSGASSINGATGTGALALLTLPQQSSSSQPTEWSVGSYNGNATTIYIRTLTNSGSQQTFNMTSSTGGNVTIPQSTVFIGIGVCFVSGGTTYTFQNCGISGGGSPSGSSLTLVFGNPTDGSSGTVNVVISAEGNEIWEIPKDKK